MTKKKRRHKTEKKAIKDWKEEPVEEEKKDGIEKGKVALMMVMVRAGGGMDGGESE